MPTLREHLGAGPFALTMSSGFFAFYAHTGMLSALEDEGLVPSRISGSSAGALVGAAWASGVDARALADDLLALQRKDFWDPGFGAGVLRGLLFRERLERLLHAKTFEGCRVPIALSAFHVRTRTTHVLDRGELADPIRASCAVPLLFHPVDVAGQAYFDGGILDRPGLLGMPASEERVLFHHIPSKSPWRRALVLPKRAGMVTLAIDGLPRSGPFALEEGRRAFRVARAATRRALDRPLEGDLLVVR